MKFTYLSLIACFVSACGADRSAQPDTAVTDVLMADTLYIEQAITTGILLSVLLVVFVLMLAAEWIHRVIGDGGASIISRIMGLIFGSVGVANMLSGIADYFGL